MKLILFGCTLLFTCCQLWAQECFGTQYIMTGYSTVDGTTPPQNAGALDLNWEVIFDPGGATSYYPTVMSPAGYLEYFWAFETVHANVFGDEVDEEDLRVVYPTPSSYSGAPHNPGIYVYRTTFSLDSDVSNFELNFKYLADNQAKVYLNDVLVSEHSSGFFNDGMSYLKEETIVDQSLFVTGGVNTIDVMVINYNSGTGSITPTGMMFYAKLQVKQSQISGYKINDLNANGEYDPGEPGIGGVQFLLKDENGDVVDYTYSGGPSGYFAFSNLPALEGYSVEEVNTGWTNTFPGTGKYEDLDLDGCDSINDLLFLNTEFAIEPCTDCIESFAPVPNQAYWVSAWINVSYPGAVKTYDEQSLGASVEFVFLGAGAPVEFYPTGEIVDGWQRVVGKFVIPAGTQNIILRLNAHPLYTTYFDDIRIHPFNASMKSYVYDGETFWLVSELDDNNYATIYEYDEEGGLIRIKKETERGIVTIQETRSKTIKL